ncbi:MAG: DUF4364 family protein [Lachnospiraceae bacterium]|nr:DUF4364 family protein [Lachnospiraceae bacterium]
MDHQPSENKLILLYLIHEKENIKSTDLYDFVLFHGYMEYFTLQSMLAEMELSGLVVEMQHGGEVYYTTLPEGDTIVEMFRARIPHSIREDIRSYALNSEIHGDSPLMGADVEIEKKDEEHYEVRCRVLDYDRAVLDIMKTATSEEMANRVRNTWLQKGMSVYWNIIKELD